MPLWLGIFFFVNYIIGRIIKTEFSDYYFGRSVEIKEFNFGFLFQIFSGEELKRQKPDPEIYLTAAESLNLPPEKCLAFEDSPAGVTAAKLAGMSCAGVLSTLDDHSRNFDQLGELVPAPQQIQVAGQDLSIEPVADPVGRKVPSAQAASKVSTQT